MDSRTRGYLAAAAVGLLGVAAALRLAADLRRRGTRPSHRQLAVAGVLLATLAAPFLLPADTRWTCRPGCCGSSGCSRWPPARCCGRAGRHVRAAVRARRADALR